MFLASLQPPKLQALPGAWAAVRTGSSLLYSPPHGAAFQTVPLLCSCRGSAEIKPPTPAAFSPDCPKVTGLALGVSIPRSDVLRRGKRAGGEPSPLVLVLPKQSPAEDREDGEGTGASVM